MKKKGRDSAFRCSRCGKFISYKDIDDRKVDIKFTPDTELTVENTEMTHKNCKNDKATVLPLWGSKQEGTTGSHTILGNPIPIPL